MKSINNIFKTIGLSVLLVAAFSCDDLLDTDPSVGQITREEVLADANLVRLAVNGLYTENLLVNWAYRSDLTLYIGVAADDVFNTSTSYDDLKNNTYTPTNAYTGYIWQYFYQSVFYSNDILELVDDAAKAGTITQSEAAVYSAEAKYFRAYSYFALTALWGDVPLVTSTDILKTSLQARESKETVSQFVIDDLKEVAATLADASDATKVTGTAAKALLARQYLYAKDYANAEKYADDVIKNSGAVLEPDLGKVFVRSSRETLFKTSTDNTYSSYIDRTYIGYYSLYGSYLRFTDDLVNSFEAGDLRFAKWVKDQGT
ncbi:MAG: RagB/SusD family nutrient uptake outer membrane protein, partial [Dysgonamonadaceae bacterium]|nr:RagB/SusD family nutrient uptake outer membrane protein [Dysgonamonadaceae bacterium]